MNPIRKSPDSVISEPEKKEIGDIKTTVVWQETLFRFEGEIYCILDKITSISCKDVRAEIPKRIGIFHITFTAEEVKVNGTISTLVFRVIREINTDGDFAVTKRLLEYPYI
jgi:hypothetical protein